MTTEYGLLHKREPDSMHVKGASKMKKEIECWVIIEDVETAFHEKQASKYVTDIYNYEPEEKHGCRKVKATLIIHDYPEQKIELTASQIREAYDKANRFPYDTVEERTNRALSNLGFTESGGNE